MSGTKFSPGSIYATPGVPEAFSASGDDILAYLVRHVAGDWGEVNAEDWRANEESLRIGERLLSVYIMSDGGSGLSLRETALRRHSCCQKNTKRPVQSLQSRY